MVACCAEKTYAATTIADVVCRASVSRTTFYKLFEDKRDCFDAAVDSVHRGAAATRPPPHSPARPARRGDPPGAAAVLELMAAEPALAQLADAATWSASTPRGRALPGPPDPGAGSALGRAGEPRRAAPSPASPSAAPSC